MDEVVKQSGVSKSNIYYHFKSKDELALAVLDFYISSLQILNEQAFEGNGTVQEKLEQYTDQLIRELVKRSCTGGCPLISLMVEAGKTSQAVQMRLARFFREQTEQLAVLLKQGAQQGQIGGDLPAHALASIITSWLEGSLMLASIQKSVESLKDERNALLGLLKASS
jgi:TetR/AcrR family transcriptional regulator, transcriptional repressor for nem operon